VVGAQLLNFRVPTEYGGAGSSVREVMHFIIELAAADSNIAQALRPNYSRVEGLRRPGAEAERAKWYPRFLAGEFFGNAGWEIGGKNGAIATRIVKEGDHYKVNGSKFYSTGSLYSDWISASALDEEGQPVGFLLPVDREGLVILDDFDAMGQRLTASGTVRLENVTVYPDELRKRDIGEGDQIPGTPFLQLYLGAVVAGIAKNALSDAVAFANQFARPIKHSPAEKAVDDVYVQLAVGEISARAYAAEAVILKAADAIDAVWENGFDHQLAVKASIEVAQAQFIAADAALKASELVFDVGGGSATQRKHNLDRHWRNARTVINHNPRLWKAAVVGAYRLSGTEPPKSGLF
jgi:alkylation response protein AidB-like acyl-CoA dehydrogenase